MTLAALRSDLVTLLTTPLNATGATWSDLDAETLTREHRIPAGEARLQIGVGMVNETGDSNANALRAEARVNVYYNATTAALQKTWVETHLQAIGAVAVDRSAWRALASVAELDGGPDADFPEKVGNVVAIQYVAIVQLA